MREIKFRAWYEEEKEMQSVRDIYFNKETNEIESLVTKGKNSTYHTDVNTHKLMQYTGLKDKNGVEIYEGDLVQVDDLFPNDPFNVWFRDGLFHIGNWNTQGFMNAFDFYEVVGNIYENPELLETKKSS
ncbi:MAG: YopX family protein [Vagococcus sp.]|uniref:YopX family protein n=1 Tax=Vagococcus sp. TaxID=1933889 RepID=UPI002FC68CCB